MDNVIREIEILRKNNNNNNKNQRSKHVSEMKNSFDKLINRLGMAKKRISKLEDFSIECPKLKCNKNKNCKRKQNIQGLWDNIKKCNSCNETINKRRKKKENKIFETITAENFPKLMSNTKSQIQKLREHQTGEMTKNIQTQK